MRKTTKTKTTKREFPLPPKPRLVSRPRTELDNAKDNLLRAQERLQTAEAAATVEARRKAGYAKVHTVTVRFPDEVTPADAVAIVHQFIGAARNIILSQKAACELSRLVGDNDGVAVVHPADKPK